MFFKNFLTKAIFSISLALSISACGGGSEETVQLKHQDILMIGDSLTDDKYYKRPENYWVKKLQIKLDKEELNATMINQAGGGENTLQAIGRIPEYLKTNADIVFIFIGTNDVFHLSSPEDTNHNIRFIMDKLLEQKPRHFIITNLKFPIGLVNYSKKPDFVHAMESIVPQIAKDYKNVTVVDDYFKNISPQELTDDGFHVIETSQDTIVNTMLPIFREVILQSAKD